MIKLAYVFRSAPYGSSSSREGLDALLAATAFCEPNEIAAFFIEDGLFNLLVEQHPEKILQRDVVNAFKLLELNDIEQRYVCIESAVERDLIETECAIECIPLEREELMEKLQSAEKILTF